jgi:hypothetical protein
MFLKRNCVTFHTDFGLIYTLTMVNNTHCTPETEQGRLVTVGVVWMVAASFVFWTVRSEFLKNI